MSGSRNNKKDIILSIYQDERKVFRLVDIAMITGETKLQVLVKKMNYYVGKGKIRNPRKGVYTKTTYDPLELSCKIYSPSYISLQYVLQRAGVIFQYDSQITIASYLSRKLDIEKQSYRYRKLKASILVNITGISQENNSNIALPERAFLDLLYLEPNFYFDNTNNLDISLMNKLLPVYQSKALTERYKKHFQNV